MGRLYCVFLPKICAKMIDLSQNSPIKRWIEANQGKSDFDVSLKKLLAFACADWIHRGSGQVISPEKALALVVAANLPQISMGPWLEDPSENSGKIADFCEKIKVLPLPKELCSEFPKVMDLRGVVCPRNAARSRLVLAGAPKGTRLDIYLDEGSPIENVPQSLVADGHIVENREKKGDFWVISVVAGGSIV